MTKAGHREVSSFWLAASVAILGLVLAAGFAPAPAAAEVSADVQQACTPDVFRLCNEFVPDVAKITACMIRKRPLASPACRAATAAPHVAHRTTHHHSN